MVKDRDFFYNYGIQDKLNSCKNLDLFLKILFESGAKSNIST